MQRRTLRKCLRQEIRTIDRVDIGECGREIEQTAELVTLSRGGIRFPEMDPAAKFFRTETPVHLPLLIPDSLMCSHRNFAQEREQMRRSKLHEVVLLAVTTIRVVGFEWHFQSTHALWRHHDEGGIKIRLVDRIVANELSEIPRAANISRYRIKLGHAGRGTTVLDRQPRAEARQEVVSLSLEGRPDARIYRLRSVRNVAKEKLRKVRPDSVSWKDPAAVYAWGHHSVFSRTFIEQTVAL